MNTDFIEKAIHFLFELSIVLLCVGMFYSKGLMSSGIISLSVLSILRAVLLPQQVQFKRIYLSYSLIFFAVVLSGFNSENTAMLMHHIQMKLAFIAFPIIGGVFHDKFIENGKKYLAIVCAIVLITTVPTIITLITNYSEISQSFNIGKSVVNPLDDHVKYSMLVGISAVLMLYFCFSQWRQREKWWQILMVFLTLYSVVFVHIIGVRTGIVQIWIGGCFMVLYHIIHSHHRYRWLLVPLFILSGMIALQTPLLQKKLGYARYDLQQFRDGNGIGYSDSERLYGYDVALNLIRQHPVFGVGIGDLKDQMNIGYVEKYKAKIDKYPHNQYLFFATGCGMFGLILFLIAIIYPIIRLRSVWSLFMLLQILFATANIVENAYERTSSAVFIMLLTTITIALLHSKPEAEHIVR